MYTRYRAIEPIQTQTQSIEFDNRTFDLVRLVRLGVVKNS